MDKLKKLIQQHGRWEPLNAYINRIEAYSVSDFSQALENSKALLETIGKEICRSKSITLEPTVSINSVLKKAFTAIGYQGEDIVTQISSSLATIGHKMGALRNEIGTTAHGKSLDELKTRNDKINDMTKEFLINSTSLIACFLIDAFETENPRIVTMPEIAISYDSNKNFNDYWDETYGDFYMGDYSFPASEILYHVDYQAYALE